MSKYQCSHIEYPDLITALQASGISYNFQRDIIAGPSYHLGINNGKIYVTQGHKHICALTNFWKSENIEGKHTRDAIKAHKMESGCGVNIFKTNLPIIEKCITKYWVSHTWKFMWEKDIIVQ